MNMPIRFDTFTRKEMELEDIRRYAPSAFAQEPHTSRSERYVYLSTSDVLEELYKQGFKAFSAVQARSRDAERHEYTKHLIRLRHPDMRPISGVVPEVALLNSHDGSSAYKLKLGAFRLVCCNGMIMGQEFAGISVYHTGNIRDNVIEAAYKVVEQAPRLMESIDALNATECSQIEAEVLAGQVLAYQHGDNPPVEPWALTQPRRDDDRKTDLWHRYNVIQENATKGGLAYRNNTTGRRNTTRAVRGIDGDLKLNAALWDLTQQMLAIKNGNFDAELAEELL